MEKAKNVLKYFLTLISVFIVVQFFAQQINPNPWVMAPDTTAEVAYTIFKRR
jgi:hypothetical protein